MFDVAANIGLFTLFASQLCNNNANIYTFELIQATFEVLQRNVQRFNLEKIKAFSCGLSLNSETVTFAFYPNASGWSTLYPDDSEEQRDSMKKVVPDNLKQALSFIRWLR